MIWELLTPILPDGEYESSIHLLGFLQNKLLDQNFFSGGHSDA